MAKTVPCPRCKEQIQPGAAVCRHCQHELSAQEIEAGEKQAKSASTTKMVAALVGLLLVGWCANSMPDTTTPGSSGSPSAIFAPPKAIEVKTDDAYAKASTDAHCSERYPADFSMRAACGRNAESGRGDFIDIWNRFLKVPPMMTALEECFDRYTTNGVTDFAMAGACARNQQSGYEESVG